MLQFDIYTMLHLDTCTMLSDAGKNNINDLEAAVSHSYEISKYLFYTRYLLNTLNDLYFSKYLFIRDIY